MDINVIQRFIDYCCGNNSPYSNDIIRELKKIIPSIEDIDFGRILNKSFAVVWVKSSDGNLYKIAKYDYDYNSNRYNLWTISKNTKDNNLNSLITKINENSDSIIDILKIGIFIWELRTAKK